MYKYIKIESIENFTPSSYEYNAIKISITYVKNHGLIAYIQEGKFTDEGGIYNSFSFDMFGSKQTRVLIEPMKRNNKKQVLELGQKFFMDNSEQDLVNFLINK